MGSGWLAPHALEPAGRNTPDMKPGRPTRREASGTAQHPKGTAMLRFHPTSPAVPPTVLGLHDKGLVQLDMTSVGGDIDEYELTVQDALRLSQRLRDSAMAMQEFINTQRKAPA